MALFRGIQEYTALNANNIVNISDNIFLYPPQGHPILYKHHPFIVLFSMIEKKHWHVGNCLDMEDLVWIL